MRRDRKWRASSVAEWKARLSRWQASGSTVSDFCLRERVSVPCFYLWRRRLGPFAADRHAPRGRPRRTSFLPVTLVAEPRAEASSTHWCELIAGTLICRVPHGVDDSALRRLMRLLREEGRSC